MPSCRCKFCGRSFANEQAVRAHLKSCEQYQEQKRERPADQGRETLGSGSLGEAPLRAAPEVPSFDPVRQLQQRVATERLKLDLRNVEEAHAEMDRKAKVAEKERLREAKRRAEAAEVAEREHQEALKRAEGERKEREERERAREERESRHREAIQDVKKKVVHWWSSGLSCDDALKSRVLRAIERKLSQLPVEDLPESELVTIATGIRESFFQEARRIEEDEKQHEANRQRLIEHGERYAERELRAVDGLDLVERWRVEKLVKSELANIEGDESLGEVEDIVESVFEDEGIDSDDDGEW